MKNLQAFISKNPEFRNQGQMTGEHKGIVVDVRDPFMLGRARVWCYGLHGDVANLNIYDLPWAEISPAVRGQFGPPELFDRVLVTFEAGNKYSPRITGYWYANPAGRGKLPHSEPIGSEIRPEAWHNHDLSPETIMLASSGIGNSSWIESKVVGGSNVASVISSEDTGGKIFRTRSYHLGSRAWMVPPQIPDNGPGTLNGGFGSPGQAIRTGTEVVSDPTSGSITVGGPNLGQLQINDSQDFTLHQIADAGGTMIQHTNGKISRFLGGGAEMTMSQQTVTIPSGVGLNFVQCPKRWDS